MASLQPLWWTTPLQALAALSSGWNCGASTLQSILVLPMLQQPTTPLHARGTLLKYLLSKSDTLFPRVNAFGEVLNLATFIIAFLKRDSSPSSAQKWPFLLGAFLFNIGTTVWSLTIQVPINNKMKAAATKLEADAADVKSQGELESLMAEWRPKALVRASMMMAACALGMYSVFLDGRFIH